MTTNRAANETQIRLLIDNWAKAVRAKDVNRLMAYYAQDILSFDAIAQLQLKGADAYRKHWEACLSLCQGPIVFEIQDLNITAGEDVAFSHCLNRCGGTGENGKEETSWMRATVCYRKINGNWMVAHEHYSAPFDMESGKALLSLKP